MSDEYDWTGYESGPFCEHWSHPDDCEECLANTAMETAMREALIRLGYSGDHEVTTDERGHVRVRWAGREVIAVSIEAAIAFIESDHRAKQAEALGVEDE